MLSCRRSVNTHTLFLLGLVVLFVVMASGSWAAGDPQFFFAQDVKANFPYLSPDVAQKSMLINAFTYQMGLFGAISDTTAAGKSIRALNILALAAVMVGSLLIIFNAKYRKAAIVGSWLLLVVITVFAPFGSKLLFYPLSSTDSPVFLGYTQAATNSYSCTGDQETKLCGFTPQLAAIHVAAVLQLTFSDIFNSRNWTGLIEQTNATQSLKGNIKLAASPDWLRRVEAWRNMCGNGNAGSWADVIRSRVGTAAGGSGAPTDGVALATMGNQLGNSMGSVLNFAAKDSPVSPPSSVVLYDESNWPGKVGASSAAKELWEGKIGKYEKGIDLLYHANGGDPAKTVRFEGADGGITIKDALTSIAANGFFATGKVGGQGQCTFQLWGTEKCGIFPGFFFEWAGHESSAGANGGWGDGKTPAQLRVCYKPMRAQSVADQISTICGSTSENNYYNQASQASYLTRIVGMASDKDMKEDEVIDWTMSPLLNMAKAATRSAENYKGTPWQGIFTEGLFNNQDFLDMPVGVKHYGIAAAAATDNSIVPLDTGAGNINQTAPVTVCIDEGNRLFNEGVAWAIGPSGKARQMTPLYNKMTGTSSSGGTAGGSYSLPATLALTDIYDRTQPEGTCDPSSYAANSCAVKYEPDEAMAKQLLQAYNDQVDEYKRRVRPLEITEAQRYAAMMGTLLDSITGASVLGATGMPSERAAAENGSSINMGLVGSKALTTAGGWGAIFFGSALTGIGAFLTGPLASAIVYFMTLLVDMSLMLLIVLTPIMFFIALAMPSAAAGVLTIAVMGAFILKAVPITLLILNNIGYMVYVMIGASAGDKSDIMKNLIIIAMGGLYANVVGLTFFLLFKIGDPQTVLSRFAAIDGSAKQIADRGMAVTVTAATIAGTAAAAAVTGGLSAAAMQVGRKMGVPASMMAALEEKTRGKNPKDGGEGGDKDGNSPTTPNDPNGDGGAGGKTFDENAAAERMGLDMQFGDDPDISDADKELFLEDPSMPMDSNGYTYSVKDGKLSKEPIVGEGGRPAITDGNAAKIASSSENLIDQMGTEPTPTPDGAEDTQPATSQTLTYQQRAQAEQQARQDALRGSNANGKPVEQQQPQQQQQSNAGGTGPQSNASGTAGAAGTNSQQSVPGDMQQQNAAGGQQGLNNGGGAPVNVNVVGGTITATPSADNIQDRAAQLEQDKAAERLSASQGNLQGYIDSKDVKEDVKPQLESLKAEYAQATSMEDLDRIDKKADSILRSSGTTSSDVKSKEMLRRNANDQIATSLTRYAPVFDKLDEKQRQIDQFKQDNPGMDDKLMARELKRKGLDMSKADQDWIAYRKALTDTETAGLTQAELASRLGALDNVQNSLRSRGMADKAPGILASTFSGAYGALAGGAGGISRIPIIGSMISESLNEVYQAPERARAWNAAGGFSKWYKAQGDAQRMGFYQKEMAPLGAAAQYNAMDAMGGFQIQADVARQTAAEAVAKSRSQFEAMLASRKDVMRGEIQTKLLLDNPGAANVWSPDEMNRRVETELNTQVYGKADITMNPNDPTPLILNKDFRNYMTANELYGLGRMESADRISTVRQEAMLMQGQALKIERVKGGMTADMLLKSVDGKLQVDTEKVDVALTADMLNKFRGDLTTKKFAGSFDEMMINHYGIAEKQFLRGDVDWNRSRDMNRNAAAASAFARQDVSTDYLIGGHLKMVEGKDAYKSRQGQYEYLRAMRNKENQMVDKYLQDSMGNSTSYADMLKTAGYSAKGGMSRGEQRVAERAALDKWAKKEMENKGQMPPLEAIFNEAYSTGLKKYRSRILLAPMNTALQDSQIENTVENATLQGLKSWGKVSEAAKQRIQVYHGNTRASLVDAREALAETMVGLADNLEQVGMINSIFKDVLGSSKEANNIISKKVNVGNDVYAYSGITQEQFSAIQQRLDVAGLKSSATKMDEKFRDDGTGSRNYSTLKVTQTGEREINGKKQ